MEITTALLAKKFNEFNATYFAGQIPMVSFTFSNTRNNLGMYFPKTHTIRITRYYKNMTEHDMEEILIHEMVHAWQNKTHNNDTGRNRSHGPRFYKKANEINAMSKGYFHISRLTTLSQETKEGVKARVTNNNPFIMGKKKGSDIYYLGKVTEKALTTFPSWLSSHYDELEYFYVDDSIAHLFSDYPISRIRFNYHKISKNFYEEKINPYTKKIQVLSATR